MNAGRNSGWGQSLRQCVAIVLLDVALMVMPLPSALPWEMSAFTAHAQSKNASAPAAQEVKVAFPVEKEILANGLTVLYHVDRSIPLVSFHSWFRVGSKHEQPGLTGIAHLFEHMMFKGAKKYSGDDFDLILQSNGATNNAFTTNDYTGYYINAPSSKLELLMDIESDRMSTLKIDKAALDSEREVVREERRYRVDDNPIGLLWEGIFGTVFKLSPYRWPVIGSMEDLGNVTPEIAQNFHRTFYAPNNAVIVVAGDFEISKAKSWIRKYYGALPRQEVPAFQKVVEAPQTSARSQFIRRDVQAWTVSVNWLVPEAGTDDAYALDLLASVMGQGTSSRLYRRLVYKEQWATSAGARNSSLQDAGLFQVFVTQKPGADFERVQRAVYGEMWRPRNLLVSNTELETARNQLLKSHVDSLKTLHGRAEALATNEILFADYTRTFTDLQRYMQVTAADLKRVAAQYLTPEKSSLVVIRPQGGGSASSNVNAGQGGGR